MKSPINSFTNYLKGRNTIKKLEQNKKQLVSLLVSYAMAKTEILYKIPSEIEHSGEDILLKKLVEEYFGERDYKLDLVKRFILLFETSFFFLYLFDRILVSIGYDADKIGEFISELKVTCFSELLSEIFSRKEEDPFYVKWMYSKDEDRLLEIFSELLESRIKEYSCYKIFPTNKDDNRANLFWEFGKKTSELRLGYKNALVSTLMETIYLRSSEELSKFASYYL